MYDLSVVIPARNEMFLARTIQDILANIRGNTEIIAVLDGEWADPPIEDNERVTLVYLPQSAGQRAATNMAVRMSSAKYIMKLDAHCAMDEGFDVKLMADMQWDWTLLPTMRNLHVYDWVCKNDHRRYQGPSGVCKECGEPTEMDVVWIAKKSPQSTSYCFDSEPHFQYFGEFKKRPEGRGDLTESMSIQGSCFMIERQRYLDLNVCDETWGSWGSQGIEVACKSWLSGGKVMVSHKTWYAHLFRTQGGDFSFPYPLSGSQVSNAKKKAREVFFTNSWEKQVRPLSWLVEKFWPVPGWTENELAELKKADIKFISYPEVKLVEKQNPKIGVVYYTDNRLDEHIMQACQSQLLKSVNSHEVISVSLQPIDFGANIHVDKERGYLTMFEQILTGLEASTADIIFFAEHDILYNSSHFDFLPERDDTFYYNQNCWKVDYTTGRALFYICKQTSQLCAHRDLLLDHYRKRVERTRAARETMGDRDFGRFIRKQGFEPGSHGRAERVDDYQSAFWVSEYPNIDIRHGKNLTPSRWRQDQFRDQRNCRGWTEAKEIIGWGDVSNVMEEIRNG